MIKVKKRLISPKHAINSGMIVDYDALYNSHMSKLTIVGDDGKPYKSLLAHNDLKKIILGLSNKELTALIRFLKAYRQL
jgi:hypothetical protein